MNTETIADPGLEALMTMLHFQGVAADRGQIRHRLGNTKIGAPEILHAEASRGDVSGTAQRREA